MLQHALRVCFGKRSEHGKKTIVEFEFFFRELVSPAMGGPCSYQSTTRSRNSKKWGPETGL